MRGVRRAVVITEFVFFLGLAIPPQLAIWSDIQPIWLAIWVLLLLVHSLWFNRKALLSYLSTKLRASKRGLRQLIALVLAACMVGLVVISIPKFNIVFPGALVNWLPLALAAVILGHIWLNRKPFFAYLGKRSGFAAWLFGCLLFCLGILARL